jgi:hypothetical protein
MWQSDCIPHLLLIKVIFSRDVVLEKSINYVLLFFNIFHTLCCIAHLGVPACLIWIYLVFETVSERIMSHHVSRVKAGR